MQFESQLPEEKRCPREQRERGERKDNTGKKIDRDIRPRWKDAKNQTINDMFDGAVGPWMIVMPGLFMELLFLSPSLEDSSSIFVFFMKLLLYILSTHITWPKNPHYSAILHVFQAAALKTAVEAGLIGLMESKQARIR